MMTVKQLREKIQGLPGDMDIIGECGTGQEDIDDVKVCHWEQGGFYFAKGEKVVLGETKTRGKERLEKPVLKIIVHY